MPRLPDYTALGERPAPAVPSGVASYEPGNPRLVGTAGAEMVEAGHEVGEANNLVMAAKQQQDEIVAQAAGNSLQEFGIKAEFDPQNGFRNFKGGNAVGAQFTDGYLGKFKEAAQSVREGLQDDNQRRIFDKHADMLGLQFQSALLQHQARETETFNDGTANSTIDLALRTMAQDPTNELKFQTSLAQINGTVDATVKRKGFSPQAATDIKAKYLDAAYTTRIQSVIQGIPGVVRPNPYVAEKMFEQVQDQLGPQSQVHLAAHIQKAVQGVQARDTANALIFGGSLTSPQQLEPAATGAPLEGIVRQLESGGDMNAVSPKGATSDMQVIPSTSTAPGYGVRPAQPGPDGKIPLTEVSRVGRDYLGAMTARYGEPALTLAAYNAGPGKVDQWIAKYGDPRTGGISADDWASKIPFPETRAYVTKGLKAVADQGGGSTPVNVPTANQLKVDLGQRVQAARKLAEQQYPGDTAYADSVAQRVESYGRQVISDATAQQAGARDTLMTGLIGKSPDGSDRPKSVDALLADPQMRAAWDQATPETRLALQDRLAKGDKGFSPETFNTYYQLKGKAIDDPDAFAQMDLGQFFGKVPDAALHELVQQQGSINKKDASAAARDINWNKAKGAVEDMLKPLGMGRTSKPKSVQSQQTEAFYGQLSDAMQQYHDQNSKWPDVATTRSMATSLLTDGKQAGGLFWDSATKAFQSPDLSKFYIPLPTDKAQVRQLQDSYARVMGHAPSAAELQAYYTKYRMAGGK